jgi:signal transduction histidine kinase
MNFERSTVKQHFELPAEWWLRMGHDLREPISPMRLAVQLLKGGHAREADREDALQLIDRQIDRLLAKIDDLGEIMRLCAGTFTVNLTASDLNLVLAIVCGRPALLRNLDEKQIALHCVPAESAIIAEHDPSRVAALLEFLIRKSAQHAASGDTLILELRKDAGRAHLGITGAGSSLAVDPDITHVAGTASGAIGDLEAKPILMREIARLNNIAFGSLSGKAGIFLSMPVSQR